LEQTETKKEIEELIRDFEAPGCSKKKLPSIREAADLRSTVCRQRTANSVSEK
jgi:hypothetical protein